MVPALIAAFALALGACTGGPSAQSFCDVLRKGPNPLDVFNSYDPSDAAGSRATLQQGVDRLQQLGAAAPSDVKNAISTLVEVAKELSTALDARSSNQASATIPDFSKRTAEITQASATVTGYASTKCGVQLDPNAPTTTAPATPPSS